MNKQIDNKAIEEMGKLLKVIEKDVIRSCTGFCRGCGSKYKEYDNLTCYFMNIAERLYNAGYRNVHDFAKWHAEEQLKLSENVRKETAREILDKVSKKFGGSWLVELYKNYGVEVE